MTEKQRYGVLVRLIYDALIADEINVVGGYPAFIKSPLAALCVSEGGWPSIEDAIGYLDEEFTWQDEPKRRPKRRGPNPGEFARKNTVQPSNEIGLGALDANDLYQQLLDAEGSEVRRIPPLAILWAGPSSVNESRAR